MSARPWLPLTCLSCQESAFYLPLLIAGYSLLLFVVGLYLLNITIMKESERGGRFALLYQKQYSIILTDAPYFICLMKTSHLFSECSVVGIQSSPNFYYYNQLCSEQP